MDSQFLFVLMSSLILGFRHGVDWDHIAAITDLAGIETRSKQGMFLAFMYTLGHGSVILILGIIAVGLSEQIPSWLDSIMERFVAVTLIVLGLVMFITIIRQWNGFELKSRWTLVMDGFRQLKRFIFSKVLKKDTVSITSMNKTMGRSGAFVVGIIHGFGAETPTQIMLISTAAGMKSMFFGSSVVFSFVIGLMISTSLIAVLTVIGFMKSRLHLSVYRFMGFLTAAYSFSLGVIIFLKA
ncbi:HoxN/HupN/NixA family nickel/cobalt transporter [Ferviditalea candida]|uniref:Nickel/cobalt efflux system n=1 Tax=Ferviditalea candida TaxID=3108399 RepID=A0ABU5ZHS3_9BACL|nr:hypothetical protein [Paenibacillaceae bacterium T2]